jgi:hypothetical protein
MHTFIIVLILQIHKRNVSNQNTWATWNKTVVIEVIRFFIKREFYTYSVRHLLRKYSIKHPTILCLTEEKADVILWWSIFTYGTSKHPRNIGSDAHYTVVSVEVRKHRMYLQPYVTQNGESYPWHNEVFLISRDPNSTSSEIEYLRITTVLLQTLESNEKIF